MIPIILANSITSIGDSIVEFIGGLSGLTSFIDRVWATVSALFNFLGDFLNSGVQAVLSFFTILLTIGQSLPIVVALIPPFIVPFISLFVSATLAGLALSAILELL